MSAISSSGSASALAAPAAVATKKKGMKSLLFVDTDSVCSFFEDKPILAGAFAKEKNQVLAALPASYREKFNTVGFASSPSPSERGVRSRPVQILSPYAVEPGPLRRAWVEAFLARQESLPYLVYWFDKHHENKIESRITLVPPNEIISYEEGVQLDYHKASEEATPSSAEQDHHQQQRNVKALELLAQAHRLEKPCFTVRPDDELFTLVPRSKKFVAGRAEPASHNDGSTKRNSFIAIGARLSVHCNVNNTYHDGVLCEQRGDFSLIAFENGEQKWIPLRDCSFKILPGEKPLSAEISPQPLLSYRSVSVDLQIGDDPSEQLAVPSSESLRGLDPSATTITPTTTTQTNPSVEPMANYATKTTLASPPAKQTNQVVSLSKNADPCAEKIQKNAGKAKMQSTGTSGKTSLLKASKQKKPEDYPKQALTAFHFFASEERKRIKKLFAGKDLDSVENNPDSQYYISEEQIRLLTHENGKQNAQEVTKFVAQNWKKLDGARMKRYNEMAAVDKERFLKEKTVYNAKKRSQSDTSTMDPNKRHKTEAKANDAATKKTTNGTMGSAETNKFSQTKGKTGQLATTTASTGTTESSRRSQPLSPAVRNTNGTFLSNDILIPNDILNYRKLKTALLQSLESLPPDSDPNATEQHRGFLETLLEITFTDVGKNSGIRRRVKQLRKNPKLSSISNQVLTFWNVDLETQDWKAALLNQNLDLVVEKVMSLTWYLQKKNCICNDLVERVGLRQLIADTEAFYAKRGHKEENTYLPTLKTIVGSVVNEGASAEMRHCG